MAAVSASYSWPGLLWRVALLLLALLGGLSGLAAHPMPSSRVLLDVQATGVAAEVQLPLSELQPALAVGGVQFDPADDAATLAYRLGAPLRAYLPAHLHALAGDGRPWTTQVLGMLVRDTTGEATGPYREITVRLWLQPPPGASSRWFSLRYDAIMHQVVTHSALVAIRQDWEGGVLADAPTEVGVIQVDPRDNSINTVEVAAGQGSWWRGVSSMVQLGMRHIGEGTDHLLFLLALLLPAPLLARGGRWAGPGTVRYALGRLLRIVTAFTAGHSLTLLLGALGWVQVPGQWVETCIAASILVSAVHAWRPVFAGREAWVAGGFGLVHGLAFASTLAGLYLDAGRMVLSILGFNVGIELMQLAVVACVVPWLLLMRGTPAYRWVRLGGAALAATAALGWLTERLSNRPNFLTEALTAAVPYAPWLLAALALGATLAWWQTRLRPLAA